MQYLDSIQPPLALYGDLWIEDDVITYYCEDGKDRVRYTPDKLASSQYYKRLQHEKQQTTTTQINAAIETASAEALNAWRGRSSSSSRRGIFTQAKSTTQSSDADEAHRPQVIEYDIGAHVSFKDRVFAHFKAA